jgi:hypothetical protein
MNSFYINNFTGGVNQSKNASFISFNESPNMYNAEIEDGLLSTARGFIRYSQYGLNNAISAIGASFINDVPMVLIGSNNSIYKLTDTGVQSILNGYATDDFDFINFEYKTNQAFIFANGIDNLKVYDGTTVKTLLNRRPVYDEATGALKHYVDANGTIHATEATITTYAPKGKFIELYKDRLFMAGDTEHPDRVYYSTAAVNGADIEDWTYPIEEAEANMHGGYEEFPTWDGGHIIGLRTLFGEVTIFKNKQIIQLYGTYPGNYEQRTLFISNGAISDKSIVFGANRCFFLDNDGIYAYDGVNVVNVSEKIKDIIASLNKDYLKNSVGVFYNGEYILAVPYGASTVNNMLIIFNPTRGTYRIIKDIEVKAMIEFQNKLIFSNSTGYVYKFSDVYTFDGTPINMKFESCIYDGKAKNIRKYTEYLYFSAYGSGSVKISIKTDKKIIERIFELTNTEQEFKRRVNNSGRNIQIIIENVNGSEVHLKSPTITLELDED